MSNSAIKDEPPQAGLDINPPLEGSRLTKHVQSGTIIVQTFHVAPGPAAAQSAAYIRSISDILDTSFLSDVISSQLSTFFLGPMHVAFGDATPRSSRRTTTLCRRDKFDSIAVQLIERGRARGQASSRAWVSDPGTIMFLDFGQTFVVTDEEHRSYINFMVPRFLLASLVNDPIQLHGLVLSSVESAVLGSFMRGLVAGVSMLRESDAPALVEMLVGLVEMSIRNHVAPRPSNNEGWLLEEAERLITLRLAAADLTPEWLAAKLDVSRSELYASFKHKGGVSRWIWQRRLRACHDALQDQTDERGIAVLAEAHGFGSAAHFSRMYKDAYGMSPSKARSRQT